MKIPFKAIKVSDKVYWVGAIDWALRSFHGYRTSQGSTYNAYLVLDEKITLIDTVKAPFKDELLGRISSLIDPREISFIVSNHTEMDHTGCLAELIDEVEPEAVYASTMGAKALGEHFHWDKAVVPVKDGDSLSLGSAQYTFYETRMLHWPDSMFSYLQGEGVLFSQDGFGMHLASSQRFVDELEAWPVRYESAKYYANIIMPYANVVLKLLDRLGSLGLDLRLIAPDHGPLWRGETIKDILAWYRAWATRPPTRRVVVTYDTMWESTHLMARVIGEGALEGGCEVKLMPLGANHRSDVATAILEAGALVVGSPTMNNNVYPTVADMLTYIKGLRPKGLIGAAFGSHGWSGEGVKQIRETLTAMGVDLVGEVSHKYVPDLETLSQGHQLGMAIAHRLREIANPA